MIVRVIKKKFLINRFSLLLFRYAKEDDELEIYAENLIKQVEQILLYILANDFLETIRRLFIFVHQKS